MKEKEFIRVVSIYQAGLDKAISAHAWPSVLQLLEELKRVTAAFHPLNTPAAIDKGLALEQLVTELIREKDATFPRQRYSGKVPGRCPATPENKKRGGQ